MTEKTNLKVLLRQWTLDVIFYRKLKKNFLMLVYLTLLYSHLLILLCWKYSTQLFLSLALQQLPQDLIPGLSIVLTGDSRDSSWEYLLQPVAAAWESSRQENEP